MAQSSDSYFFDELKDWSERKHSLISKYITSATKILGKLDRVYYIDGFAGRGTYGRNPQEVVPGSPVRAAQFAQKLKDEGKNYSLYCINVEADRDTFVELEKATKPYTDVVKNLCGAFSENVDEMLSIVGNNPVLCFLDPFGIDGIDLLAIQKLINRGGVTDFWIRFEAGAVRRRDGYYSKTISGADKNFDILRRVYGIYDDNKLHDLLSGNTSEERKSKALNLYLEILSKEFAAARGKGFAAAYRIGSIKGDNKYHLVFSTANNKGLNLASDIIFGIEEDYQREVEWYRSVQTSQPSLFPLNPSQEDIFNGKVDKICNEIIDLLATHSLNRRTIHSELLKLGWFGEIKGRHITAALRHLIDTGKVQAYGKLSDDKTIFKLSNVKMNN